MITKKCLECKQPLKEDEIDKNDGLCLPCFIKKIINTRIDAKHPPTKSTNK